ncbi:MAG: arginine N-succinyltransferase [Gammaproteobacteria bacterium]|nr:arginine N-succinyltransferase [Gammaproteobacteria bacterium]
MTKKGLSGLQVLGIVLGAMLVTIALTLWLVKIYFFPSDFTPVVLSEPELQLLTRKLDHLDPVPTNAPARNPVTESGTLQPEAYSETGASREIRFSERELNALLANNTDLARKVAIDLSDNLISARILMPMDPDFPFLGGKTIRARAGMMFSYKNDRPVVILRGVSIMGVPLPNAWLGGLKNIDLVNEFGNDEGFWKAFAEGVALIRVEEGNLMLKFNE